MSGSILQNFPVEIKHVSNSYVIVGVNPNRFRGGSTRHKPKRVKGEYIEIPKDFYQLHKCFSLTKDVMSVNCILFLVNF